MRRWIRLLGILLLVGGLALLLWASWPTARESLRVVLPVVLPPP